MAMAGSLKKPGLGVTSVKWALGAGGSGWAARILAQKTNAHTASKRRTDKSPVIFMASSNLSQTDCPVLTGATYLRLFNG